MRTRYFRTADGWVADVLTAEPEFSVEMASHEMSLSEFYGTPVAGVEVDEGDPRTGEFVPAPLAALEAVMERAIPQRPIFTDEEITFLKALVAKG